MKVHQYQRGWPYINRLRWQRKVPSLSYQADAEDPAVAIIKPGPQRYQPTTGQDHQTVFTRYRRDQNVWRAIRSRLVSGVGRNRPLLLAGWRDPRGSLRVPFLSPISQLMIGRLRLATFDGGLG